MNGLYRDVHRIRYLPTALLFSESGKDLRFLIVCQSVVLRVPFLFGFSHAMPGTEQPRTGPVHPFICRNKFTIADGAYVLVPSYV